jgi:hypothetical protein
LPWAPSCYERGGGGATSHDKAGGGVYTGFMRTLFVAVPLLALLVAAVWFAGSAWVHLGGDAIPLYGYVAIVGGVLFSLLIGGGLMALVFYSNRHGYDDIHRLDK